MRVRIFRTYYQVVGPQLLVHLYGRDEAGARRHFVVRGSEPHFYTPEWPEHPDVARIDEGAGVALRGSKPLNRIVVKFPFSVPKVRAECTEALEADILYELRCRYDWGLRDCMEDPGKVDITPADVRPAPSKPRINPRVVTFDIETYHKGGDAIGAEYPTKPVLSIAAHDSHTDRYVAIFNATKRPLTATERQEVLAYCQGRGWQAHLIEAPNEAALFAYFKQFLDAVQPDVLLGHNSDGFDVPYLQGRARNEGFAAPNWNEYAYADTMLMYVRQHEGQLVSKGLDYISKSEGFEGKNKGDRDVWWLYENDPAAMLTYNVNDVFLTRGVEQRKNLIRFFYDLAAFVGMEPNLLWNGKRFATTRAVESFLFHKLKQRGRNEVQPSKPEAESKDETFEGAMAHPPQPGFHKDVMEFDLSGEYANVMRTFNMSPETYAGPDCKCGGATCYRAPSGNHYLKEPRGIIPESLDELLDLREQLKKAGDKEQERVVKELILSYWGTVGNEHFRNRIPEMAADIAHIAREHNRYNGEWLKGKGLAIVCGFTDATYCKLPNLKLGHEELKAAANRLVVELNASYDEWVQQFGITKHTLGVKLEHVYDAMFVAANEGTTRGSYICLFRDPKGPIERDNIRYDTKVRGLQSRKSSSAPLTRSLQNEIFVMALLGDDAEAIKERIRQVIADLKSGKIAPEECQLPLGWEREEYKTKPWHVKAAEWSNRHLNKSFGPGSKPCMYFVKSWPGKNPPEAVALDWRDKLPEGVELDWDKTLQRVVYMPLAYLFEALNIRPSEIEHPTAKADEYF